MNEDQTEKPEDDDAERAESLLAYSWKALELAGQHFARLDTKATSLATFVGVSATILVAVSRAAFPAPNEPTCLFVMSRIAFGLLLFALFTVFAFCLCALAPRAITQLPRIRNFIGTSMRLPISKDANRLLVKQYINQISLTEDTIYSATTTKEVWLKRVLFVLWLCLLFGVISSATYTIDTSIHPDEYRPRPTTGQSTTTGTASAGASAATGREQAGGTEPRVDVARPGH